MSIAELNEIETTLGIRLPGNYRLWALQLPPVGQEREHWHWIFNDKQAIIEVNESLRRDGCCGAFWPPELFCMGRTDGIFFFLSIAEPEEIYCTDIAAGPYFETAEWKTCEYKSALEFYADI